MPTGYTADVADGTVTDFRTFALRCARAFGATIMQRDDPMNEPPKHREPSPFYATRVADAKARYEDLTAMSVEEAEVAARMEFEAARDDNKRYAEAKRQTRNRYNAMLADVIRWMPPTPDHDEMKRFMVEQLRESIKFDCTEYPSESPAQVSGAEWLATQIRKASGDIGYYTIKYDEEVDRCAKANAWIDALYESLGTTADATGGAS